MYKVLFFLNYAFLSGKSLSIFNRDAVIKCTKYFIHPFYCSNLCKTQYFCTGSDDSYSYLTLCHKYRVSWASQGLSGKEFACQCKRHRFNPWVRKVLWRRKWQPTPRKFPCIYKNIHRYTNSEYPLFLKNTVTMHVCV